MNQSNVTTSPILDLQTAEINKNCGNSMYEPKETFKLAALNSITRGVKYNDLSYMSGRDLNKLRKEPEAGEDFLYGSAHINLTDIRKSYDSVHKEKNARELSISKLKEEINKLEIFEKQFVDKREDGNEEVKTLTDRLEKIKHLFAEADIQKKVLLNMRLRLKTDRVTYDQRNFDLEKELRFLRKQKEVLLLDKNDMSENDDRRIKVAKKYTNQLKAEKEERENHLRSIQTMIDEKSRVNELNEYRSIEVQEIAERAMQDKSDSQKSWEKLYFANKLLSFLLREKMEQQMNKFLIVETAFKTIKIATGVSDADSLVHKFLNKEEAYGDLLGKIAQNEKRILVLKEQKYELERQFKQLEAEKQTIDSTKRIPQNVESEVKKLNKIESKEKKSVLFNEKMRSWIGKTNKKMNSILNKQYPINIDRSLKSISAAFINFIKALSTELDATKDKKVDEAQFKIETNNNFKKVLRVQDGNNEEEEEQIDGNEEGDTIANQRNDFLKANEKFMKDARKKFDQKRRIFADSIPTKKREEKVQIKKPGED